MSNSLESLLNEQERLLVSVSKGEVTLEVALTSFNEWKEKLENYSHETFSEGCYAESLKGSY